MVLISVPLGFLGYYFNKFIIKHEKGMYIFALSFSVLAMFYLDSDHLWVLKDGFLGLALFIVVMYAGAFKRNSAINKKLRSVRKIFSIMGFIFIIPHSAMYLMDIINEDIELSKIVLTGVLTVLIMFPIFVISFKFIKKRMNIKKWTYYQKYSYIAYFSLFLHLILINNSNALLYIGVFGLYFAMKLKNYLLPETSMVLKYGVLVAVLGGLFIFTGGIESSARDAGIDYSELILIDGIYNVYEDSYSDHTVILQITVEGNTITKIYIIDHGSTDPSRKPQYYAAAEEMVALILEAQSTDIDSIAGSTETTDAILDAVDDVIERASTPEVE